jgi:hypothetical protein
VEVGWLDRVSAEIYWRGTTILEVAQGDQVQVSVRFCYGMGLTRRLCDMFRLLWT